MSLLNRIPKLRRLELQIGLVVLLMAAVVVAEQRYAGQTFRSGRDWSRASAEVKVRIAESHLWLEERLGGDATIDVPKQVFANIEGALTLCRALRDGGRTQLGEITAVPAGPAQAATGLACRQIRGMRGLAAARLRAVRAGLVDTQDDDYDRRFTRSMATVHDLEDAVVSVGEDRETVLGRANTASLVFLLLLAGGIVVLVRRHRRREAELSERSESILNSAGEGIYGIAPGGSVAFVNPAAARMTGHAPEELIGGQLHALVHHSRPDGSPYPPEECPMLVSLTDGTVHRTDADVYWRKDGSCFPVEFTSTPLRDGGQVKGAVVVFRDITERRDVERAKDEFTSVVSHELRTPLTAIQAALGLLDSGAIGPLPAKGKRMVEIAMKNSDRLLLLINDILDIDRIGAAETRLHKQRCDAAELIERVVEALDPVATGRGLTLSVEAEPVALKADPDRLIQVLTNLVGNALKFSPEGADIRISSVREGEQALFRVTDEGRGIPPDKLESIFERFQQVDATDSRENGGTGLGLSICRMIVEEHGGRIWAESRLGEGSCFLFAVPALPVDATRPDMTLAETEPATLGAEL